MLSKRKPSVLLERNENLSGLDSEMQHLLQPSVYIRKNVTINIVLASGFFSFYVDYCVSKEIMAETSNSLNL